MTRPARALIDTAALRHNLQRARQLQPDTNVMAVIKANGYGHGMVAVGHALADADGFGVATVEEALVLRDSGIDAPITVLEGFFEPSELAYIRSRSLIPAIHAGWQLDVLEADTGNKPLPIWLKVNTGMNRLGFMPEEIEAVMVRAGNIAGIGEIRLMSHLACADEPGSDATQKQIHAFRQLVEKYGRISSLANSAGVVSWPATRCEWQRPGIMLYGASPVSERSASSLDLQPVMTVKSALIAVNQRNKGDAIGYGGAWTCPEDMPIGVVAFGYGDGYPRHAPPGTPVLVAGKQVSLVGRVSMDMITVDLRQHPSARVGDEVVLWGRGLPVDEVARHAGTISYELLCHVTERVPRLIVGNDS